jgi:hypothetical protein
MSLEVVTMMHPKKALTEAARQQQELVRRVASSVTFEKSPRLRAFFTHVCRCAFEDKSEEATEQQIGIYVYGRQPGFNPNDDNIVRSQARMLRMKLEHHFVNEGKDEPVVITIPKGQYLPVFETRFKEPLAPSQPIHVVPTERHPRRLKQILIGAAVLLGLGAVLAGYPWFESRRSQAPLASPGVPADAVSHPTQEAVANNLRIAAASGVGEIRIAAGHTGASYIDVWGHRWESDHYYAGGIVKPGPEHFFPPFADEGLFKSIREAASVGQMAPEPERGFQYNIPVPPGVYELRLYFADPLRMSDADQKEDSQNVRHFQIDLNGHPLLEDFDPVTDGGASAVDIRVFKDVRPDTDGKVHLEFHSNWGEGAFVSGLELTPGTPGSLKPIRITVGKTDFVDSDGVQWSGDKYFIDGRTWGYENPKTGPRIPAPYTVERHGNFSYAIPVAQGSYTVRLHFVEAFFSPLIPAAHCNGVGCRVFDVTCNGVTLLQDFDIFREAPGAFKPVIREFHGLHPNGQGKLLLSFSPKVNYAEIRAIEVIDEAR